MSLLEPRMPSKKAGNERSILIAAVLALSITLALALNLSPLLRGGAGWRWPYEAPDQPLRLLPGIAALALYLGMGMWALARIRRRLHTELFLAFCVLGGLMVQVAFLYFVGNPIQQLFYRTVSSVAGGFYEVGVRPDDMLDTLRHYPDLMRDPLTTAHPKAHPPGIPLLFWATSRLFALMPGLSDALADIVRPWQCHHRVLMALPDSSIAAAALGMALPLVSLLAVLPVYDLSRRLYGSGAALRAALWLPLIPALVMFTPQWNQFYVLLAAGSLWLIHRGLVEARPVFWALTGLLISVGTFLSFTNVNLLGLVGLYGIVYAALVGRITWSRAERRRIALGGLLLVLALPLAWLIFYAVSGITFFDLLNTALTIHYGLNEPYAPWLFFFPMDLFLFGGLILAILALIEGVRTVAGVIVQPRAAHPQAVLPLTLWIAVLVLNFSGLVRGEVGRLLLWLMPLFAIAAARAVEPLTPGLHSTLPSSGTRFFAGERGRLMVVSAALGVQVVVMVAFLRVIGTELAPAPFNPTLLSSVAPEAYLTIPANAHFDAPPDVDGSAELLGFGATMSQRGEGLFVTFVWRGKARFDHPYFVSAVVVDEAGTPLGAYDWLPVEGSYPTSCWAPGETIYDQVEIPLNGQPSGDIWISLALFDFETRERLTVSAPGLPSDTQVGLGPIPTQ